MGYVGIEYTFPSDIILKNGDTIELEFTITENKDHDIIDISLSPIKPPTKNVTPVDPPLLMDTNSTESGKVSRRVN